MCTIGGKQLGWKRTMSFYFRVPRINVRNAFSCKTQVNNLISTNVDGPVVKFPVRDLDQVTWLCRVLPLI